LNHQILLAEDDRNLCEAVKIFLESQGFVVYAAHNGLDAYGMFKELKPDLAVFDIDMPGLDGFKLTQQIRKDDNQTPIIFATAYSPAEYVARGFNIGADDYIRKPVDVIELVARIRYHLKNKTQAIAQGNTYTIGQYTFNSKTFRLLHPTNGEVKLTNSQGAILQQLCANLGKTVLREALTEALWGKKTDMETRSIDTHVSSLRKYLKDDPAIEIRKCYGQGYQLVVG
jgi:DNA-binding response OmpR family regulator